MRPRHVALLCGQTLSALGRAPQASCFLSLRERHRSWSRPRAGWSKTGPLEQGDHVFVFLHLYVLFCVGRKETLRKVQTTGSGRSPFGLMLPWLCVSSSMCGSVSRPSCTSAFSHKLPSIVFRWRCWRSSRATGLFVSGRGEVLRRRLSWTLENGLSWGRSGIFILCAWLWLQRSIALVAASPYCLLSFYVDDIAAKRIVPVSAAAARRLCETPHSDAHVNVARHK